MAILADVAPYSREYNTYRQKVGKEAQNNTELEIEYEKILNRVKQTRESVIKMSDRHFTAPVDEISGTVEEVSPGGITLKEYPGRRFQFSSVSTSAADMSARILGEHQVSSSWQTQKTSRTRQTEAIHDLRRSLFLTSSSSLYMESRSVGSFRPAAHKNLHARARSKPSPRFGVASSPVLRSDQRGRDRMVSPACRTQKPARARPVQPAMPLPGSLSLYIRMGKHGSVSLCP
jgi:hypothetical protein